MRSQRTKRVPCRAANPRSIGTRGRSDVCQRARLGSAWRIFFRWSLGAQFLWAGTVAALGQPHPTDNQQPASPWSKPFAPAPTLLPPLPSRSTSPSSIPVAPTPSVSSSAVAGSATAPGAGSPRAAEVRRLSGDSPVRTAQLPSANLHAPTEFPQPPAATVSSALPVQASPGPQSTSLPPAASTGGPKPEAKPATVKLLGPTPALGSDVAASLPPGSNALAIPSATPNAEWNRVPAQGVVLEPDSSLANAIGEAANITEPMPPRLPPPLPTILPPNLPAIALPSQTPLSPQSDWSDRRRISTGLPEQSPTPNRIESSMVSKSRVSAEPGIAGPATPIPLTPGLAPLGPIGSVPVERSEVERFDSERRPLLFPTAPLLNPHDPGRFDSTAPEPSSPRSTPTTTPTEWQSVEVELKRRLEKCDTLLRRNGVHSAREEINQGLIILVRHIEGLRQNEVAASTIQQPTLQTRKRRTLEPALQQALLALDECADFHETIHYPPRRIERMVEHHATTALKGQKLESMSNALARQAYLEHASRMFLVGTERHPWAAELLYALGKTYERELPFDSSRPITLRSQAAACFEAAHQIAPSYGYIANELGFTLVHLDRLEQAHAVLQNLLASQPSSHAWRNLAEVHRRRGAIEESRLATAQADAMDNRSADLPSAESHRQDR